MPNAMIEKIVEEIARGSSSTIASYLDTIEQTQLIGGTRTNFYSHMITRDGNGSPRLDDFADFLVRHVVEYAIPRSRISEAKSKDAASGLSTHIVRLNLEAQKLFTPLKTSGEGGELLLFVLGEVLLKLPQLFCKMSVKTAGGVHFHGADGIHGLNLEAQKLFTPLKTSGEGGELLLFVLGEVLLKLPQLFCKMSVKTAGGVHFHGADGIHVGIDPNDGALELYWGESKFHSTFDSAIADCLDSVSPFLKREADSDLEDLLLLQTHLDLGNPKYTEAIKQLLDKDNPGFKSVKYCGLCLIGFNDENVYTPKATKDLIRAESNKWKHSMKRRLTNRSLESFHVHFFCLPVICVDSFRNRLLERLGLL
jgi:hypothetical protein